jgi:hypothetical protein
MLQDVVAYSTSHPPPLWLSPPPSGSRLPVFPGPEKLSRPHSIKTTAIFEAFTANYPKFAAAWYFKAQQQQKTNKHKIWGGIFFYFISAPHFWIKHYTNFLNLTKFLSQHLIATHGLFHRHQFLTTNNFFIRPVLSYLAVATATWQHYKKVPRVELRGAGSRWRVGA